MSKVEKQWVCSSMIPTFEASGQPKQTITSLVPLATIIGALTAVLIVILTNARTYLEPLVFNVVVTGFSITIIGLAAFYFVVKPLWPLLVRWQSRKSRDSVAVRLFPELANLAVRFAEISKSNYAVGIHQAIRSFQVVRPLDADQHKVESARDIMERLFGFHHNVIDVPVEALESAIESAMKGKSSFFVFSHFVYELWNLIWVYKIVFVNTYVETCKKIGEQSVADNSKEQYVKFASKYNQFAESFADFGKKANRMIGQKVMPEFVEDAGPLRV
jgi:hypothetical protein